MLRVNIIMRPKKSKKKFFARVKTEIKSEICICDLNEASSLPFAVEDEVLACWQDGLYYLAVVKTVRYSRVCVGLTVFNL